MILYTMENFQNVIESYVGETGRRLKYRVDEHSGKDSKSNMLRHYHKNNHRNLPRNNFQLLANGYKKIMFKRKLSEASHSKEFLPSSN